MLAIEVARLQQQVIRLDGRIDSERDLTDAKFATLRTVVDAQAEHTAIALSASDKAIGKSEQSYDKRFDLLNELRSGVATSEQFDSLEKRIIDLAARMDRSEGHWAGTKDNKAAIIATIGAVGVLLGILVIIMNTMGGS